MSCSSSNAFRYTHAVVCRLPDSFATNAIGINGTIDLNLAKEQHATYVSLLRELGLDVIELPSDEALPDCVFVEDTAIVVNGTALICRPGHPARQKEVLVFYLHKANPINLPLVFTGHYHESHPPERAGSSNC